MGRAPESEGTNESERLARRYFTLYARHELDKLVAMLHADVEIVLKSSRGREVLRGREAVAAYFEDVAGRFHEAHPDVFRPLDDARIVVEGRMRWMDDDRILRDDPMIWALEFRGGLLLRSIPAQSVLEAQSLLAVPPASGGS